MTNPPPNPGGPPQWNPEQQTRYAGRIALVGAGIAAAAAIIAAVVQAVPDYLSADPPSSTSPSASPSTSDEKPTPGGAPTDPPQSRGPTADRPVTRPVACSPDLGGDVTVLDVRSNEGGTDIGGSIIVTVQLNLPATGGGAYWLMVSLPDDPRPIEIARQPLGLEATQEIAVTLSSGPGSVRTFYVAYGDRQGVRWFEENKEHDGDSSWDGNRATLPDGVRWASNSCQVIRTE